MFSFEAQIPQNLKILFLLWNIVLLFTGTPDSQEPNISTRVIGRDSPWFRDDQVPHQSGPIQTE